MVKTSLVETDIAEGQQLINELKKIHSHFPVQAAFWLNRPEVMEWRLYLATPLVDQHGPFTTYADLQNVLRNNPWSISLQEISVVSPKDKLVKVVKNAAPIPPGAKGIRFGRTRLNDTYIEDAYVYRV